MKTWKHFAFVAILVFLGIFLTFLACDNDNINNDPKCDCTETIHDKECTCKGIDCNCTIAEPDPDPECDCPNEMDAECDCDALEYDCACTYELPIITTDPECDCTETVHTDTECGCDAVGYDCTCTYEPLCTCEQGTTHETNEKCCEGIDCNCTTATGIIPPTDWEDYIGIWKGNSGQYTYTAIISKTNFIWENEVMMSSYNVTIETWLSIPDDLLTSSDYSAILADILEFSYPDYSSGYLIKGTISEVTGSEATVGNEYMSYFLLHPNKGSIEFAGLILNKQ